MVNVLCVACIFFMNIGIFVFQFMRAYSEFEELFVGDL